jgi:PadR family transcriptional regulator, regulatory protein PadR
MAIFLCGDSWVVKQPGLRGKLISRVFLRALPIIVKFVLNGSVESFSTLSVRLCTKKLFHLDAFTTINYIAVIMPRPPSLGEFEQVVLLAILRLDDDAYGVTIRSEIAACTGREPAPGALYTTLDRMQEKGIVRSWLGDSTPQRGGRPKRYFAVTKAGRSALVTAQQAYRSLLKGLNLLGGNHA